MTTFLLSYRMPEDYVPGEAGVTDRWRAWFDSLGDQLTNHGNPVFERTELGNCGPGTRLGGYSLITAPDLQTAITLAKGCPAVSGGSGGVEVGVVCEVVPAG
jgi:hypothetical protein